MLLALFLTLYYASGKYHFKVRERMKKTKQIIAALFMAFGLFIQPAIVLAQQQAQTGSGLSISPTRTDLVVDAGTSADLTISIKNVTGGGVTAKAFVNDFQSDNVSGEPKLIVDPNQQVVGSIKKFLNGLNDVPLAKGESKDVKMSVNIPADTPPGAYYGVIRFQAVPVDQAAPGDGQVALTASVGSIVLIEVPGNITEKIRVNKVGAYAGNVSRSIMTAKPAEVGIEIENLGNGFAKPFGRVEVKNMFGKLVKAYELNNSNPRGVVLPESKRLFKDSVEGVNLPGRYTISSNISYGRGGDIISATKTFWYLPFWFVAILLVVLFALIFSAWLLYRRYISQSVTKRKK
jgi:hypothetical protein